MFEKLIEVLVALIAAINANTAAQTKGAPVEEKKPKKEKAADTSTTSNAPAAPTVAEVRAAATAFLEAQKDQAAQAKFMSELNGKYGTKRISEAPADKFPEIIAALNAEVARLKAPAPAASASDAI